MKKELYKKCKDLNILFVEDYLPLQKKVASILNDYFKYVKTVSNGLEGLLEYNAFKKTNTKPYDVVLTDYEMPKLNGIDLIHKIKKDNENQIFVIISAHQNPENLIEFINLDINHFISKPIGTQNILAFLDKISTLFTTMDNELFYLSDLLLWDRKKKTLIYDNKHLDLAKYDTLLLEILIENFNFICHIEKILSHFYLHNEDIKQDNIRNMVVRLRKKVPYIMIESSYGQGYKLSVSNNTGEG
jgi:DNA-binding response OmpR family regulator